MKILLPLTLLILISACDSSSETSNNSSSNNSNNSANNVAVAQAADKPPEELLGKTVSEYQEIKKDNEKQQAKPSATSATEATNTDNSKSDQSVAKYDTEIEKGFLPLKWEGLIAPGFDADSILKKYEPMVKKLEEGSEEANKLYEKMQAEYNKAPANESLANKKVSIPGFIAPLEQSNGVITEFLLVPYFGACIHQPAPPANQTVHVKTASNAGINAEDAYDPIWVSGELLIDKETTDIGTASYKVKEAKIQKYDMDSEY